MKLAAEFKKFLFRGNVVDLAVAVVVGTAFTAVITALVADLLTPLIAAIFGKHDFSTLTFTINGSTFKYGAFINARASVVNRKFGGSLAASETPMSSKRSVGLCSAL